MYRGVVTHFNADVYITEVFHHTFVRVAVNIEHAVTKTFQTVWHVGAGEVVFGETLPEICLLEVVDQGWVPDLVVIPYDETFTSLETVHEVIERTVILEGDIPKVVHVIVVLYNAIPALDHQLVHFFQTIEWA